MAHDWTWNSTHYCATVWTFYIECLSAHPYMVIFGMQTFIWWSHSSVPNYLLVLLYGAVSITITMNKFFRSGPSFFSPHKPQVRSLRHFLKLSSLCKCACHEWSVSQQFCSQEVWKQQFVFKTKSELKCTRMRKIIDMEVTLKMTKTILKVWAKSIKKVNKY